MEIRARIEAIKRNEKKGDKITGSKNRSREREREVKCDAMGKVELPIVMSELYFCNTKE